MRSSGSDAHCAQLGGIKMGQPALDCSDEFGPIERLADVVVHACLKELKNILRAVRGSRFDTGRPIEGTNIANRELQVRARFRFAACPGEVAVLGPVASIDLHDACLALEDDTDPQPAQAAAGRNEHHRDARRRKGDDTDKPPRCASRAIHVKQGITICSVCGRDERDLTPAVR